MPPRRVFSGKGGPRPVKKKKGKSGQALGHAIMNSRRLRGKPKVDAAPSGHMKRYRPITKLEKATKRGLFHLTSVTEATDLQEFVEARKKLEALEAHREETTLIFTEDDAGVDVESALHSNLEREELYDYANLPIPWRPKWDASTTKKQLEATEESLFLEWRRSLARIRKTRRMAGSRSHATGSVRVRIGGLDSMSAMSEEMQELAVTPFEKNLEVWRQLWRVVERSDVVCLIVDARNILAYMNRDLVRFVKSQSALNPHCRVEKDFLVVINKADYLTPLQRQLWAQYLDSANAKGAVAADAIESDTADFESKKESEMSELSSVGIEYVFFSATAEQLRKDYLISKSAREAAVYARSKEILENVKDEIGTGKVPAAEKYVSEKAKIEEEIIDESAKTAVPSSGKVEAEKEDLGASVATDASSSVLRLAKTHVFDRNELLALLRRRYLQRKRKRIAGIRRLMEAERMKLIEESQLAMEQLRSGLLHSVEKQLAAVLEEEQLGSDGVYDGVEDVVNDEKEAEECEAMADASTVFQSALESLPSDALLLPTEDVKHAADGREEDGSAEISYSDAMGALSKKCGEEVKDEEDICDLLSTAMTEGLRGDGFFREDVTRIVVGMVGFPNVGKSSVINVLLDSKSVAVAATPGKTKHLATLHVADDITVCDCPGLVFPNMMASKADLVLSGVLSVDTLTDFMSPMRLLVHRIDARQFLRAYAIRTLDGKLIGAEEKEAESGKKRRLGKYGQHSYSVTQVLDAYCRQKKIFGTGGMPVRTVAARVILKDFIRGKLVYSHPPPKLSAEERYQFHYGKLMGAERTQVTGSVLRGKCCQKAKAKKTVTLEAFARQMCAEAEAKAKADMDLEEESGGMAEQRTDDALAESESMVEVMTDESLMAGFEGIGDEEFLELYEESAVDIGEDPLGRRHKKGLKKHRAARRSAKRRMKGNRAFRHDACNFETGSNMVSVTAVPSVRTTYASGRASLR